MISRSGLANREVTAEAWEETGESARRFVGRFERRSWEVGMDSGIGSDMVMVRWWFVLVGNETK